MRYYLLIVILYSVKGGSNFWICGWNTGVWSFKWKLLKSNYMRWCLFQYFGKLQFRVQLRVRFIMFLRGWKPRRPEDMPNSVKNEDVYEFVKQLTQGPSIDSTNMTRMLALLWKMKNARLLPIQTVFCTELYSDSNRGKWQELWLTRYMYEVLFICFTLITTENTPELCVTSRHVTARIFNLLENC